MARLDEQQQAVLDAVLGTTDNIVVEALAGTGKTHLLVNLLAHLKGTVFMCAFGKDAANQLLSKAAAYLPARDLQGFNPRVRISTTNSIGARTWNRSTGKRVELDESKVRKLLNKMSDEHPLAAKFPASIAKIVSYAKKAGFGVLADMDNPVNWTQLVQEYRLGEDFYGDDNMLYQAIAVAMGAYRKSLAQCDRLIDYDDQILAPMYHGARFGRYDWVLIDEAQDTSELRLHMLLSLVGTKGRLIAVGDPHQSIMAFTGAKANAMAEIVTTADAVVMHLNRSYRVPKTGATLARVHVPMFEARDENPEGDAQVCDLEPPTHALWGKNTTGTVPKPSLMDYGPFTSADAILCRNTAPLVALAYKFIRSQVPCRVEGREIGTSLLALAKRWQPRDLWDLIDKVEQFKRNEVARLLKNYRDRDADNCTDRCDTLTTLIQCVLESGKNSLYDLTEFVDKLFDRKAEDCVTLSTAHKAKGREWQRVFVLGLRQLMPSPYAVTPTEIDQEHNLLYVAKTRHRSTFVDVVMPESTKEKRRERDNETLQSA